MLDKTIADIIEKSRRKRIEERRAAGNVRLGIMRHVYIILDLSDSMMDQDLKPNRLYATFKVIVCVILACNSNRPTTLVDDFNHKSSWFMSVYSYLRSLWIPSLMQIP